MKYQATALHDSIKISSIITIHYFEYSKNYKFSGESHDFWEFVCVDKGEVTAITEEAEYKLTSGDIIFHKPNEWHNIKTSARELSSVVIISFTASPFPEEYFEGVKKISNTQKALLSKILNEALEVFSTPLGDPYTKKMVRKPTATKPAEQLIKLYITEFLLLFMHNESISERVGYKSPIDDTTFATAVDFMLDNLSKKITSTDIARHLSISNSSLKALFKTNAGRGVIDYFIFLKVEAAKSYLRENEYSVTKIAEILGYNNTHYFSKQFKQYVGLTPTEYAKSIKSMLRQTQTNILK